MPGPVLLILSLEGWAHIDDPLAQIVENHWVAKVWSRLSIPGPASSQEPLPSHVCLAGFGVASRSVVKQVHRKKRRLGGPEETEERILVDPG